MAAADEEPGVRRVETDKSLQDERAKTDGHLERRHKEVERQTTQAIRDDRRMADEHRALAREARDRHVTEGPQRTTRGDESLVMEERELSDKAMWKERELEDSTLQRERREKQLLVEPKSRDRTSAMFVGQVVDLGLNSFPSFFSREECGHAVRLSSGIESAALSGP